MNGIVKRCKIDGRWIPRGAAGCFALLRFIFTSDPLKAVAIQLYFRTEY